MRSVDLITPSVPRTRTLKFVLLVSSNESVEFTVRLDVDAIPTVETPDTTRLPFTFSRVTGVMVVIPEIEVMIPTFAVIVLTPVILLSSPSISTVLSPNLLFPLKVMSWNPPKINPFTYKFPLIPVLEIPDGVALYPT